MFWTKKLEIILYFKIKEQSQRFVWDRHSDSKILNWSYTMSFALKNYFKPILHEKKIQH